MEEAEAIQSSIEKYDYYKKRAKAAMQSAWDMLHKSQTAFEMGDYELALKLDKSYSRLVDDSCYFDKLALST